MPGRIVAALATLGFGGALGYEGPSIYAGAAIGSGLQQRLSRYFGQDDAKVLMVAGAAAGVAAIFKAPVTGLVFALEVPYQEDLARRMLLPAGIAAATGYLVFAAVAGTTPLLPIAGQAPFDLRDLGGAAAIGVVAGIGARLAAATVRAAKGLRRRGHPATRAIVAGLVLAALFASGRLLGVANPTLGPGYDTMRWALQPDHAVLVVGALACLRLAATAATVAGGGTGGLFIPLVVEGALLGRMASGVVDPSNPTLFPVLGIAAFRGAGYRVPLASVVFVAEFTGRPGFIVPGLIAAMVAQLAMGSTSVSPYQAPARPGHLERRLALEHVVDASARTVPPDATVAELFWQHLVGGRQRAIPVVDGQRYLGMARAEDLADLDRSDWATTRVDAIARRDLPTVGLRQRVDDALHAMDAAGVDRLAVCDDGGYLGVVSVDDVIRLDDVIDRTRYGTSAAGCPASPRAASGAAREQISRSPGGSHDGPNRYTNSTRRSPVSRARGPLPWRRGVPGSLVGVQPRPSTQEQTTRGPQRARHLATQRPLPRPHGRPACSPVPADRGLGRRDAGGRRGGRPRLGQLAVGRVVPRPVERGTDVGPRWTRGERRPPALDQRRPDGVVLPGHRPRDQTRARQRRTGIPRRAAVPIVGAIGGMAVPALPYLAFNAGGDGTAGWGIPMATDVAFALGLLAVLGTRVPAQLKVLLLGLAIVDDVGAIIIIAAFYSTGLHAGWLAAAAAGLAGVALLRRARIRYMPIYVACGTDIWFAMFESGVHATIAGVALGLLTPARPFLPEVDADRIADELSADDAVTAEEVRDISFRIRESIPTTERLQDLLHPWTSYLIVPLFALANAGITISAKSLGQAATSPITLGVVAGLESASSSRSRGASP